MEYKRQKPGKKSPYSDSFRRKVVEEILSGAIHAGGALKKYGISRAGNITDWMKWYRKNHDIVESKSSPVVKSQSPTSAQEAQRIKELEAALELAKLKVIGLETLIDVAEEQLNIEIRKKPGTKQ